MIGLPGETLEMRNKKVYINGKRSTSRTCTSCFPPDESAAGRRSTSTGSGVQLNYGPVSVPAEHYFMMGDNRDNSEDSRYWGFMPRSYVKGKALFVYFSFGEGGVRWSRLLHQIH